MKTVSNAMLRKPARLGLTLGLLAAGGAMFMTALNISDSWQQTIDKVYQTRHYDVEIRFYADEPLQWRERVSQLPGVRAAEAWGYSPAAFARPGQMDVSRAYPDRGHGALSCRTVPR